MQRNCERMQFFQFVYLKKYVYLCEDFSINLSILDYSILKAQTTKT